VGMVERETAPELDGVGVDEEGLEDRRPESLISVLGQRGARVVKTQLPLDRTACGRWSASTEHRGR
jgi:hypothetical protein